MAHSVQRLLHPRIGCVAIRFLYLNSLLSDYTDYEHRTLHCVLGDFKKKKCLNILWVVTNNTIVVKLDFRVFRVPRLDDELNRSVACFE